MRERVVRGRAAARSLGGATFVEANASLPSIPLSRDATSQDCEAVLLANLEFVERTVGAVARRHALSRGDADDFGGLVKLRLISDDYAILRKFRGKSRLTTFLTTVIHNLFRDYRIQQWGKWRPSAAAKRLGNVGVQLESLLYRDHFSFGEACEILRSRFAVGLSDLELVDLAGEIRPRTTRRFESDAPLVRLQGLERGDQRAVDSECEKVAAKLESALGRQLKALDSEERLIVRLRFGEGFTIRAIAIALDYDQRRIYARVRRILGTIREGLAEDGLDSYEVLDLLDWPACAIEAGLSEAVDVLSEEVA